MTEATRQRLCASWRFSRPAGVALTRRLRASGPGSRASRPPATRGRRLRVRVEASTFIARARSTGRIGPSFTAYDSSEYWVPRSPVLPTSAS